MLIFIALQLYLKQLCWSFNFSAANDSCLSMFLSEWSAAYLNTIYVLPTPSPSPTILYTIIHLWSYSSYISPLVFTSIIFISSKLIVNKSAILLNPLCSSISQSCRTPNHCLHVLPCQDLKDNLLGGWISLLLPFFSWIDALLWNGLSGKLCVDCQADWVAQCSPSYLCTCFRILSLSWLSYWFYSFINPSCSCFLLFFPLLFADAVPLSALQIH